MMSTLLLRHEDALTSVAMQDQFVIFFTRGDRGVVPLLLRSARQWKDLSPEQAQCPLRVYLIQAIVAELHQRFCKFKAQLENQKIRTHAIQTRLITEDNAFPFHRWNGALKQVEIDNTPPISMVEMEQKIAILQQAFQEKENCVRFHALAAPNSQGEVVPWRLQIPLRNDNLSAHLKGMTQSSIWMLLASRLKVHGAQRSRLAQELQKLMHPPAKKTG